MLFDILFSIVLPATAFVAAVVLVRRRWRFTDTPTSEAAHVFPGLTEVHGTVEKLVETASAPTDGVGCVWWMYEVERRHTDSKGNSHWVTEERGVSALPFLLRDESGTVRVVLDEQCRVAGAEERDLEQLTLSFLRPYARTLLRTYAPSGLFGGSAEEVLARPIGELSGTWRAKEHRLKVGDTIFISANARLTSAGDEVELARLDAQGDAGTFEISIGDEAAAIKAFASPTMIVLSALVAVVASTVAGLRAGLGPWPGVGVVTVGAVTYLVGVYNRVRRARERCRFAWSLIDVACEQRSVTVPQLQAVVGEALDHERTLLETVAAARRLGRAPSPGAVASVRAADVASARVVALVEAMPELHTQPNVAQLMESLTLLTDRVAFGRRFYNDSVQRLADRVGQLPDRLFAALAGVKALPFIDLGASDQPTAVQFGQ